MELTAAATVGASLFVVGVFRWRYAAIGALVVAVFEGALRKWLFPDYGTLIYLAKDVLLLGAYVGFWIPRLVRRRRLVPRHPANGPLAAFALLAIIQLLNPLLPHPYVGLFGIKAYLGYVPLMYMVPVLFPTAVSLERFWTRYLLIAFVPLALGPLQFATPSDSILNRYAWEDEFTPGVATFGAADTVRVTGTFSYITGYTVYLTLVLLMGLALLVFERRAKWRLALYGLLSLTLANLLMSGSRGPFLLVGGALVAQFALSVLAGRPALFRKAALASIAVILVGSCAVVLFPGARSAFVERVEGNADVADRIVGLAKEPIWALGEAGLPGWGIGSTHQATLFLVPEAAGETLPPGAEGEWERIILEVGPLGLALVLLVRVLVSWRLWTKWRLAGYEAYRPYFTAALLFSVISLPGSLVFNQTASLFYWFLAGLGLLSTEVTGIGRRAILHSPERPLTRLEVPR